MAELGVLIGAVLSAIIIALLDRRLDSKVRVVGSSGHRDRVRRAIDRMRDAAADRKPGRAPDDP
jgi:hypothetical protein